MMKNHFGMVVSTVVALVLSACMATTAALWNHLDITAELLIRNWGTAFLTIMLTSMLIPTKAIGDRIALALKIKENTPLFGIVGNLFPTLCFNTTASFILTGVNVGFSAPYFWAAFMHDYFVMFVVSYVLAFVAERIAFLVAVKCCGRPPMEHVGE